MSKRALIITSPLARATALAKEVLLSEISAGAADLTPEQAKAIILARLQTGINVVKDGQNQVLSTFNHINRNASRDAIASRDEARHALRVGHGMRDGAPCTVKGSPRAEIGMTDHEPDAEWEGEWGYDRWAPIASLRLEGPAVGRGISPRDIAPRPTSAAPTPSPLPGGRVKSARRLRKERLAKVIVETKNNLDNNKK